MLASIYQSLQHHFQKTIIIRKAANFSKICITSQNFRTLLNLQVHNFHVGITDSGKLNKGQVSSSDNIKFHENLSNGSKRTRVARHWNINIPYACTYSRIRKVY
jgi:4-hydroxy-3-methylbut-2-en-1-yl diphosphate synthase IspG/GcpE